MGTNPSSQMTTNIENPQKFRENLDFVMETETPIFGQFKIYKMLEKPYEYIMAKTYTSLVDDRSLEKKKNMYQSLPVHKNIINFDLVDLKRVEQKCGRHLELSTFCRYYFFTLEEAIVKKIKRQSRFLEQEVLYIAKTLVSVYQTLHQADNRNWNLFRANNIFLTPQGFLKIYTEINQWRLQANEQRKSIGNRLFTFSTQNQVQLDLNRAKNDFSVKQHQSDDIIDIGVTLLSVTWMSKQSDYRNGNNQIKEEIIKFILNSLIQPDNKPLLMFRKLLKGIFEQKWQIEDVKKQLESIELSNQLKTGSRIRIINNQNQDSDLTIRGDSFEVQRQSRLKMMPKNHLVPRKIQCYSSRASNPVV